MSSAGRPLALITLALLLLSSVNGVRAADDSNSQNLNQSPTLNPQQLANALQSLSNGLNDPNLQQLLNKFDAQIKAGDFNGASSTLLQLRSATGSDPNASVALNSLLQSLMVGPNGVTVDSNLLSFLLGANTPNANGVPSEMQRESPAQIAVDLNTLANLLQYVDPNLVSSLLEGASGGSLGGGYGVPSNYTGSIPGLPGFPTIRPPALTSPIAGAIPGLSSFGIALPLAILGVVFALFFYRSRLRGVLGSKIPGVAPTKHEESEPWLDPQNPRDRVILSFRRALAVMRGRGVPRLRNETHREFSSKCSDRPEGSHVGTISTLYEKARFSGQEVGGSEASLAESEAGALEKTA